jgi:hypothetical protein
MITNGVPLKAERPRLNLTIPHPTALNFTQRNFTLRKIGNIKMIFNDEVKKNNWREFRFQRNSRPALDSTRRNCKEQ